MQYDFDKRYSFNGFAPHYLATAGVMTECAEQECFWVLDVLASYAAALVKRKADYLKIVTVNVTDDTAEFKIEDEIKGILITQHIESTDLKKNLRFWAIDEGEHTIVMLPSEY